MKEEKSDEKNEKPVYVKEFAKWHDIESATEKRDARHIFIVRGAVWLVRFGVNIGSELDGKGDEFLRPVIVVKKINEHKFLGIPVSSKTSENHFRQKFILLGVERDALLSSIRSFDRKRCMRLMEMLDAKTMNIIIDGVKNIFVQDETPQPPEAIKGNLETP